MLSPAFTRLCPLARANIFSAMVEPKIKPLMQ